MILGFTLGWAGYSCQAVLFPCVDTDTGLMDLQGKMIYIWAETMFCHYTLVYNKIHSNK